METDKNEIECFQFFCHNGTFLGLKLSPLENMLPMWMNIKPT